MREFRLAMSGVPEPIQYIANTPDEAAEDISLYVQQLLENLHLYQSIVVRCRRELRLQQGAISLGAQRVAAVALQPWLVSDPAYSGRVSEPGLLYGDPAPPRSIRFRPPDAKLFCAHCDRREPFNPVSGEEFLGRDGRHATEDGYAVGKDTVQVFVFSYQCQACKGVPEVFMLRRQGLRLTNAGRAPIEHVGVPASIPKTVSKFFSGGIVAHQSGQTLAGVFLLRTLLEQYARATTKSTATNADEVVEAYMSTLPQDFKARFPSMRSLYGELSVDIHSAAGSAELFDKAVAQMIEHFDARKLFKLGAAKQAERV